MSWIKLTLKTTAETAETYSDILFGAGAVSVSFQDAEDKAIFEPDLGTTPLWEQTYVIGLFSQDVDIAGVKNFLKQQLGKDILQKANATLETLEDQNWTRAWMDQFHPMQFGKKLWICPSGHDIVDTKAINIMLDPGLAFGTGTHPTTRLCLEWLDAHPPENALVVDYGCGSGILSIAAKMLGAALVFAVDHDPQALQSTEDNAEKNGFSIQEIIPILPQALPLQLPKPTDLLLANILANPLIELAPTFAEIVRPGGTLILSGILEEQAMDVFQHYSEWFRLIDIVTQESWTRISARRFHSS